MTAESEDLQIIAQKLKATRKELGYSQKRVAEQAGISRLRYQDIEAGRSSARAVTLVNIARALGMELVFVPQAWVPAVNALIRPDNVVDDTPGLVFTQLDDTDE
ncbi:helix-turn-helix domain-containing protein [Rhizobium sp. R86522]|uniref:helix-turn-helix domain-containing protein n=1 Tax=Rhizobium sp. R86522 TaxID=3093861 RepID=UPI00366B0CF8